MNDDKSLAVIEGQPPLPVFWDDALNVSQIKNRLNKIKDLIENVLEEGIEKDYAVIPGTKKKTLLQPGAQIINVGFHLVPRYQIKWSDLPNGHKEADAVCALYHGPTNTFVGEGVGVCSTMESKYRYRNAERVCPICGVEAIIKGQAQFGGGWVCWKKKLGCGTKFPEDDQRILEQKAGKVEYDDPADYYNTVAKIATKRAYVAATINATAASRYVTQDIGDPDADTDAPPGFTDADVPPVGNTTPPPKQEPQGAADDKWLDAPFGYGKKYGQTPRREINTNTLEWFMENFDNPQCKKDCERLLAWRTTQKQGGKKPPVKPQTPTADDGDSPMEPSQDKELTALVKELALDDKGIDSAILTATGASKKYGMLNKAESDALLSHLRGMKGELV